MKPALEVVIVCDGYGDFLTHTLPYTLRHADRVVVVTGEQDRETRALCSRLDVTCLPTYVHRHRGKRFDKAAAINHGLAHLACDGLILHLDADVVLPDSFTSWLVEHGPDPRCIYGVDRFDVNGWAEWQRVEASNWLRGRREWGYLIQPPKGLRLASRVGHGAYHGYCPIGFFQLWHGGRVKRYPSKPNADAEHTDLLHAAQWPPESRRLIADLYVAHLSTSGGAMGENWSGRTTPRFGPPAQPAISKGYS